ncbi:MAG: hypothetical protein F6K56_04155 [Moorea sp. SIO3G5]|nr:hypothetical protein [Moorena sp. SIO3G5]
MQPLPTRYCIKTGIRINIHYFKSQILSLFPTPDSRLPAPCSLLPIPYSLFPIPYSLFPILRIPSGEC